MKPRATHGTIYGIQFLDDGVFYYVGQTRASLAKRWAEHRKPANLSHVSRAMRVFGRENFTIVVLEVLPVEQLNEAEARWISLLGTLAPDGFNRRAGGYVAGMSETTKKRMSAARKKLWADPSFRERTTVALKASWTAVRKARASVILSASEKQAAASLARRGRAATAETRAKMSAAQKGRTTTPETRAKISNAQIGRKASAETKRKQSAASRARYADEAARAKHSDRMRDWWQTRRASGEVA